MQYLDSIPSTARKRINHWAIFAARKEKNQKTFVLILCVSVTENLCAHYVHAGAKAGQVMLDPYKLECSQLWAACGGWEPSLIALQEQ